MKNIRELHKVQSELRLRKLRRLRKDESRTMWTMILVSMKIYINARRVTRSSKQEGSF
jgi:hypothetical protein